MPIYNSIIETIGKTPIIKLTKISKKINNEIFAKIESFNPGSSIKDRPALNMIEIAEKKGLLTQESEIVEASSGNTGIGLALVSAAKGYRITIFMPESASEERRKIMKAFGAKVILTAANEGMKGAMNKAEEYSKKYSHVYLTQQFNNNANPDIHRHTTAVEIWNDLGYEITAFIACVGTGGTITGVGEALKKYNPKLKVIAVEPIKSRILSGGGPNKHSLEGMGAGFIPDILNTKIYDEIIAVSEDESYKAARMLAKEEGIFAGKSSGAALAAALKYSNTFHDEKILIILPDTGERYLSTDLWD